MANQQYYIRERGRVTGPFGVAKLREMRSRNRLARFHMISADGETWVSAETLTAVFGLEPNSDSVASSTSGPLPATGWTYLLEGEVHGPVLTDVLQKLIDCGAVGPEVLVRREGSTQWSICRDAGTFRFEALPSASPVGPSTAPATAPRDRRGWPKFRLAGAVAAVTTSLVVASSLIFWPIFPVNSPDKLAELESVASAEPVTSKAADRPAEKVPEPEPKPAKSAPKRDVNAKAKAKPGPASAAVKRVLTAQVKLPAASGSLPQHDSAVRALEVTLPTAERYTLHLRGLNDPEMQDHRLVARPTESGRTDKLTIIRDLVKGGQKPDSKAKPDELARFWVEEGRLFFQWAPRLSATLVEPAKSLRDCILEVLGDGVLLKLGLRGPIKNLASMPLSPDPTRIEWKREHPFRKLRILSCKVKINGELKDVPPKGGQNTRELVVKTLTGTGGAGPAQVPPIVLSVRLMDDSSEIRTELKPTLAQIREQAKRSDGKMRAMEEKDSELQQAIALYEETRNQRTLVVNAERSRSGLTPIDRGSGQSSAPNIGRRTPVGGAPATKTSGDATIDELNLLIERSRDERIKNRSQYALAREEKRALQEMKKEVENCRSLQIKAQIGMVVDGEEVDVVRIGLER
jgi:hypothetical protein